MRRLPVAGALPVLLALALPVPGPLAAQAPSIEGTYRLVSRTLPDGATLAPPDVMGIITFTKTHRNFNVFWKGPAGKVFAYSVVSTYRLTPTEFSETILFSTMHNEIEGAPVSHELSRPTRTAPVTVQGKSIRFQMPFDPPTLVFDGNTITATAPGEWTDVWERIP